MTDTDAKPVPQPGKLLSKRQQFPSGRYSWNFLSSALPASAVSCPICAAAWWTKRQWIDDKEFVEMLSISQSLPGLNATNMAVLVGEKLRGVMGSIAGIIAICLPGGLLMFAAGIFYHYHGDHTFITAALKGVAAAAVGLILSTVASLSKKSLSHNFDFVFMAATVIAVNRLHLGVPRTLIAVGILAVLFHHPRKSQKESVKP